MQHVFERKGLGKAPFDVIAFETHESQDEVCACCGKPIKHICKVLDAESRSFFVGTACAKKTRDTHLQEGLSNLVRKLKEDKFEKDKALLMEALLDPEQASVLKAHPHPNDFHAGMGKTLHDYVTFVHLHGGMQGMQRAAAIIRAVLF